MKAETKERLLMGIVLVGLGIASVYLYISKKNRVPSSKSEDRNSGIKE